MNTSPRYNLKTIQQMIDEGKVKITSTAITDAAKLDYDTQDIKRIVKLLTCSDFYKSMQSHHNEMIWHDVYRKTMVEDNVILYIKLQIVKDAIVISFKEK